MNFRNYLCVIAVFVFLATLFSAQTNAQERSRVVTTSQSRPVGTTTNTPQIVKQTSSRPTTPPPTVTRKILTNEIVVRNNPEQETLIKKTGSSNPINTAGANKTFNKAIAYNAVSQSMMMNSIKDLYGIPYRYGSTGPNRYDCSGFVWTVFQRAGFSFDRSSVRTYWSQFEPVTGDDRYQFGTLVFLNGLGHIGIVADDKGFYHASSSKGITYSTFEGYWEKRIVGFRRVPLSYIRQIEAELAK